MSTRGAFGWAIDGEEKITYNHHDSYPSGLGSKMLKFCQDFDIDMMKKLARDLRVVTDEEKPTAADIEKYRSLADTSISTGNLDEWYVLLRRTQGDPQQTLNVGVLLDGSTFPLDSLFCEWAYVIDLDTEMFEAYQGFQDEPHTEGRFADREPYVPSHRSAADYEYHPVKLIGAWSLRELPSDEEFLNATDELEDE